MDRSEGRRRSTGTLLLVVAGLVVIAVMLSRVPLASVLGLGVLLICPLLMIGMRGGHGGGHQGERASTEDRGADPAIHAHGDGAGGDLADPEGAGTFVSGVRDRNERFDEPREEWRP